MLEKLERLMARYEELSRELTDPRVYSDQRRAAKLGREQAQLQPITDLYPRYAGLARQIADDEKVIAAGEDRELVELAEAELDGLRDELDELEERIKILLLPKDEAEERKAIVEVRAGTGGDEATLFVGDLYRMYSRYAERRGWKITVMDSHPTEVGGFREITFAVEGKGAYG
ncbi:MAG TPA: PCRF domain-containing protein, partial [Candidatus Coatesbacteria bacterium]|nr:PCRF domain-containing protein [Candidatus Coatesbacteria bacterium]